MIILKNNILYYRWIVDWSVSVMITVSQLNWSFIKKVSLLRSRKKYFGSFGVYIVLQLRPFDVEYHTMQRGWRVCNCIELQSQNANSFGWIIICDQSMIRCDRWMWKMITFKAWPYKHTWIHAIIRVENSIEKANDPGAVLRHKEKRCEIALNYGWKVDFFLFRFPYTKVFAKKVTRCVVYLHFMAMPKQKTKSNFIYGALIQRDKYK